jgi:signal transduction histidine kinase
MGFPIGSGVGPTDTGPCMAHRRPFRLQDYLVAIAALAGATLVRLALDKLHLAPFRPYIVYTMAVLIAALYGGLEAGVFTTIASALVVELVFLLPAHQTLFHTRANLVPMLLFLFEGTTISWLAGAKNQALIDLKTSNDELEHRVLQRTAELEQQVAENRRINQDLHTHSEQLSRSNRELEDFASVASHDLQEPLRKIQAFGDRLRIKAADRLGPDGSDYLSRMLNAAGRMQTLINDLLTFSRVTTRASDFEPVDLTKVAQEVLADLETRVELTGGIIELTSLPTIDADATQMRQVFQNLIGNALKFHRPDVAPIIHVSGKVLADSNGDGDPGWCEITFADNGIGFDEKYLDRIFNIFQRLHGRGTYEGTGIGLAVCRKIVERHGGTITARSIPDQGSVFILRLPVHQQRVEVHHAPAQADYHSLGG